LQKYINIFEKKIFFRILGGGPNQVQLAVNNYAIQKYNLYFWSGKIFTAVKKG